MGHTEYLLEALKLAEERRGFCSPNPSVGAVIVQDGKIVSSGNHYAAGYPHAEVIACHNLPETLEPASLYITLEPCCNFGRTPPCTELILNKGFKKVYYGYQDPNPQVSGKGAAYLRQQGVDCQQIPLEEIDKFYKSYTHWTITKKPWVTCKLAISLDAKIAGSEGRPVNITGEDARDYTHESRMKSDAILTSARTIMQDDPALNARLAGKMIAKPLYVLDTFLALPLTAKIFATTQKITVFHSSTNEHKINRFTQKDVKCQYIPVENGQLNLARIIEKIGLEGIHDLWVEAGGKLFSNLISEGLAQRSLLYIAPKVLGVTAYPAFNADFNIFANAKKITWDKKGVDGICEIEWS